MLTWDNNLATGVNEIDRRHKELFKMLNKLHETCSQGKERIGRAMQFLEYYVKSEFLMEESFMVRQRYPGYKRHKAQHEEFMKDFANLKGELEAHGTASGAVVGLLGNWWTNHISKEDMVLDEFLKGMQ